MGKSMLLDTMPLLSSATSTCMPTFECALVCVCVLVEQVRAEVDAGKVKCKQIQPSKEVTL